jgi:hypothetical protein
MANIAYWNRDQVVALIKDKGRTLGSIEKELGMSDGYIYVYCKRNKIKHGRITNKKHDYSKVVKLTEKGMAVSAISEKLKIPLSALRSHCSTHGISYVTNSVTIDYDKVVVLIEKEGRTLTSIAKDLGIHLCTLSIFCKKHNIKTSASDRPKYKYDNVKIKKLTKKGLPLKVISEKLKIPYSNIYAYCKKNKIDFIPKGYYSKWLQKESLQT